MSGEEGETTRGGLVGKSHQTVPRSRCDDRGPYIITQSLVARDIASLSRSAPPESDGDVTRVSQSPEVPEDGRFSE
jgi:hypothetical protein